MIRTTLLAMMRVVNPRRVTATGLAHHPRWDSIAEITSSLIFQAATIQAKRTNLSIQGDVFFPAAVALSGRLPTSLMVMVRKISPIYAPIGLIPILHTQSVGFKPQRSARRPWPQVLT